jgi:hypothetical protein
MSPAHGTRCGEGNDGASPARGRWRGRPRGIDSDAWTTRRRGKGDGTTAYRAESATAASGRGRRRGVDDGVGMRGLAATGTEAAGQQWWRARTAMFRHLRSVTRVARRSAAAAWSGGGRLSGRTRAVPTAPLRRGVVQRVVATWRWRADKWARCGRGRLTSGSHASAISEIKFTPG